MGRESQGFEVVGKQNLALCEEAMSHIENSLPWEMVNKVSKLMKHSCLVYSFKIIVRTP